MILFTASSSIQLATINSFGNETDSEDLSFPTLPKLETRQRRGEKFSKLVFPYSEKKNFLVRERKG